MTHKLNETHWFALSWTWESEDTPLDFLALAVAEAFSHTGAAPVKISVNQVWSQVPPGTVVPL